MYKSLFLNPALIISSIMSGCIIIFNWCARHPYLIFFEAKFLVLSRYAAAIVSFYLVFVGLRAFIHYLTVNSNENSRALFFRIDLLTHLVLAPTLLKRYFIPGRSEGNRFYIFVFLGWFILKIILLILFFNRKTWLLFPERTWALLKKSRLIWNKLIEKKEYNAIYLSLIFTYCFFLQLLFCKSLPLLSIWIPFCYCIFFFSILLLLHALSNLFLPKAFTLFLIYGSFLLCILSTLDYLSFRIVNLHMSGSLGALLADGFKEIPKVLEGADVQLPYFILSIALTFSLPLFGLWGYNHLPSKKVSFSILTPFLISCVSLGVCFTTDRTLEKKIAPYTAQSLLKTFSIYPFFFRSHGEKLHFDRELAQPPSQEDFEIALNQASLKPITTPHIFVFIVESLRADFINSKSAPFLSKLLEQAPQFELTASNCNVTHPSLFTIYNGLLPHHWITFRDGSYSKGSFPLQILKKAGYKLNAFHSSFFKYFNIGGALFGKDYALLDYLYEGKELSTNVAERDAKVLEEIKKRVSNLDPSTPYYMTVLFDSTHHHYYWPSKLEVPFHPYLKAFKYTNKGKEQLELTKNRYRNSIYYVDQLIEKFCTHLKAEGLYDEALILITGDHGEEFMEFGHYFHGTDLCLPQSHVPLIYKFPKNSTKEVRKKLTSHVDIFPTIFDLIGIEFPSNFFHGSSIFSEKNSYIISFRPEHKSNPFQFYLHTGREKLEAKFVNSDNIYKSKGVEITSIKNSDETVKELEHPDRIKNFVINHFKDPLNLLFGLSEGT